MTKNINFKNVAAAIFCAGVRTKELTKYSARTTRLLLKPIQEKI